jgi:hypothetical protein
LVRGRWSCTLGLTAGCCPFPRHASSPAGGIELLQIAAAPGVEAEAEEPAEGGGEEDESVFGFGGGGGGAGAAGAALTKSEAFARTLLQRVGVPLAVLSEQ